MSVIPHSGRTAAAPPPPARPSPPSATPSPAPSASSESRASPPSSAPAAATPTGFPSSSSASQPSPRHPPDTIPKHRRDQTSQAAGNGNNRTARTCAKAASPVSQLREKGLCRRPDTFHAPQPSSGGSSGSG